MAAYSLLSEVWNESLSESFSGMSNIDPSASEQIYDAKAVSQNIANIPSPLDDTFSMAGPTTTSTNPRHIYSDPPDASQRKESLLSVDQEILRLKQHIAYLESVILNGQHKTLKNTQISNSQISTNDLMLYIATGAFLIFVLDSFLQLGTRLK